jgi:hypothetical protein
VAETSLFIKQLINDLERGRIRIPSFQRGFVWNSEQVAYFIDSIYKGFPFGSILLWRTRNELRIERNLGAYELPKNDPEYPIDYVLDGQQRITSIFGIFQNSLIAQENQDINWTNLFFELDSDALIPFKYLEEKENYDKNKFFPLRYVFDAPKYRQSTRSLDEKLASQIDNLVDKFTQAIIPVERFETEERKNVATVFERINRQKVVLGTFDLLSVWNWSEEFDLQEKFKEVSQELEEFGFDNIGDQLLLKCCSAVIMNSCKPDSFMEIPGSEVREKFEEIKRGLFGAIDFLKTNFNIFSLKLLPMENILVVLTSFFSSSQKQSSPVPQEQNEVIKKWFWRSCFSKRYARGGSNIIDLDIEEIQKLKNNEAHELGEFDCSINEDYFLANCLIMSAIATKTFIILVAREHPLNFIQGTEISLEKVLSIGNRKEFHHIYPKDYLEKVNNKYTKEHINCLANFTILSRTDNNKIKNKSPKDYKLMMPNDNQILENILKTHLCSMDIFNNDYERFLKTRTQLLINKARELCL